MKKKTIIICSFLLIIIFLIFKNNFKQNAVVPAYSNQVYIELNDNKPSFKEEDYNTNSFELNQLDDIQ